MNYSRKVLLYLILIVVDALALILSAHLSYNLRFFHIQNLFPASLPNWVFYQNALYLIIPLWLFVFYKFNMYKIAFLPILDDLIRTIQAGTICILFLIATTFFYRDFSYSRITFVLFWLISLISIFTLRQLLRLLFSAFSKSIIPKEKILVLGKNQKMIEKILSCHPNYLPRFVESCNENNLDKVKEIISSDDIHQVILTSNDWSQNNLMNFYDWCENNNIDLKFVPDLVRVCQGEIIIDSSIGIPIFHLKPASLNGFNFLLKRFIDLVISTFILSFIWPILLNIAIIIKITSTGPALYYHKRVGYRGATFNFYKFRTMILNADELLEKFKSLSERQGPVFKMSDDPRVTKMGKILRRYSIDELPQLLNVLKGNMSLVGPRPQVLWEAAAYDDWAKRRLRVLPGITGLWQTSGRASLGYEEMIELDIFYIENWSLGLDIKILFNTIYAIFSKKGAY